MRAQELGSGKLVIFDIDDTLVNTDTKVNVVRDGKVVKQLNSHDFTHYKLDPGQSFDFGAFKDAREFFTKARPIPGMIKQLKYDIATGNRVIMLTARSDFNDRDVGYTKMGDIVNWHFVAVPLRPAFSHKITFIEDEGKIFFKKDYSIKEHLQEKKYRIYQAI